MSWEEKFKLSEEEKKEIELIISVISERKEQNISQRDLAKMTGLKQSTISRMEKEIVSPRLDTLIKIINALDLEITLTSKNNTKDKLQS